MKFDKFICPISGKHCSEEKKIFVTCIGGKFDNFPLCSNCSSKIRQDNMEKLSIIKNFLNALAKLANITIHKEQDEGEGEIDIEEKACKLCPECGISFDEILEKTELGCSECVRFFQDEIEIAVDLIQSKKVNIGDLPTQSFEKNNTDYFNEIKRTFNDNFFHLNEDMSDAVAIEDYELAAVIRDSLKTLRDCLEKAAFLKEDMHKIEEDLIKEEVYIDSDLLKSKIVELENKFLQMKDIWRLSQNTIVNIYGDRKK